MRNSGLTVLSGAVAPLLRPNIDTDAISPSRVKRSVNQKDTSGELFFEWRFDEHGLERPDFVLNRPDRRTACFMIGLENFGCGSSRETAVWALRDYGIRCVIAPSFGSIFRANCYQNGVAPVELSEVDVRLLGALAEGDASDFFTLDLPAQRLTTKSGAGFSFDMEAASKRMLVEGLDAIGMTLTLRPEIDAFRAADRARRPWIYN